jgi:hypothetical protein
MGKRAVQKRSGSKAHGSKPAAVTHDMVTTIDEMIQAIGDPEGMALDVKIFEGDFNAKMRGQLHAVGKDAPDDVIDQFADRISRRIRELRDT